MCLQLVAFYCETLSYQQSEPIKFVSLVHTHPTQGAFLSSVDVHTQAELQYALPEAIAIVCALKMMTTSYFHVKPSELQYV